MWKERNGRGVIGSPPCDECRVELSAENTIPARIYQLCRGQVRLYFNGEVNKELDIDHNAVWAMIDHYPCGGLRGYSMLEKWDIFEKVIHTYQHFLKNRNGG